MECCNWWYSKTN